MVVVVGHMVVVVGRRVVVVVGLRGNNEHCYCNQPFSTSEVFSTKAMLLINL